jgi:hypothetical protein
MALQPRPPARKKSKVTQHGKFWTHREDNPQEKNLGTFMSKGAALSAKVIYDRGQRGKPREDKDAPTDGSDN